MKQAQFLVEIVIKDDKPTIIVRAQNGMVVRLLAPSEVPSFFEEVVATLNKPSNTSNS